MRKRKRITTWLLGIFFVGLSALLYPAVSSYWNSKTQSKAVMNYTERSQTMDAAETDAMFAAAEQYNRTLAALDFPLAEYTRVEGYEEAVNVDGQGMIGYLSVDRLHIKLPIYHGTSEGVLGAACGHLEGSSLPVGGAGTHAVLSAHRGLPSARLFTDLDKLKVGDRFRIVVLDRTLTYEVDQIRIVLPTDTNDIQIEEGEDYCTLLTCTPYGINTHRLLVRGRRVEGADTPRVEVQSEAYLIDRLIVTPAVALPILLALILYVCLTPPKRKPKLPEMEEEMDETE